MTFGTNFIDLGQVYAFKVELPPIEERPDQATIASLDRWNMCLPGYELWSRYTITGCSLSNFPGVPPAKKRFPDATHEILVGAIHPEFSQSKFLEGGIQLLSPDNYSEHIITTDAIANIALEKLTKCFLLGKLSIIGSKERFKETLYSIINEEARKQNAKNVS